MSKVGTRPTDPATSKSIFRLEKELENLHIKLRALEKRVLKLEDA